MIPNEPKLRLLNEVRENRSPIVIPFAKEEVNAEGHFVGPQRKTFDDLFDLSKDPSLFGRQGPMQSILRKPENKEVLRERPQALDLPETQCLLPFIQLLGINPPNDEQFLIETLTSLSKIENVNFDTVLKNLEIVSQLIDVYHNFRIQNVQGKFKTMLPQSHKQPLRPVPPPMTPSEAPRPVPLPPQNIPQNPNQNPNFKRKKAPCRAYHSPTGCNRGEACDYSHDPAYKGVEPPKNDKYSRPNDRPFNGTDPQRNYQRPYSSVPRPPGQQGSFAPYNTDPSLSKREDQGSPVYDGYDKRVKDH